MGRRGIAIALVVIIGAAATLVVRSKSAERPGPGLIRLDTPVPVEVVDTAAGIPHEQTVVAVVDDSASHQGVEVRFLGDAGAPAEVAFTVFAQPLPDTGPSARQSALAGPVEITAVGEWSGPMKVSLPVDPDRVRRGSDPQLLTWDQDAEAWVPVVSDYDAATNTVSATVDHLSFWDVGSWVNYQFNAALGNRAAPPVCSDGLPDWVRGVNAIEDRNAPLLMCAEAGTADSLRVKVAANRGYSLVLRADQPFTVESTDGGAVAHILSLGLGRATTGSAESLAYLPAGGEATLRFARPSQPVAEIKIAGSADSTSVLMDALLKAVGLADVSEAAAITLVDCALAAVDLRTPSNASVSAVIGALPGCIDASDLLAPGIKAVLRRIAVAIDVGDLLFTGSELAVDTANDLIRGGVPLHAEALRRAIAADHAALVAASDPVIVAIDTEGRHTSCGALPVCGITVHDLDGQLLAVQEFSAVPVVALPDQKGGLVVQFATTTEVFQVDHRRGQGEIVWFRSDGVTQSIDPLSADAAGLELKAVDGRDGVPQAAVLEWSPPVWWSAWGWDTTADLVFHRESPQTRYRGAVEFFDGSNGAYHGLVLGDHPTAQIGGKIWLFYNPFSGEPAEVPFADGGTCLDEATWGTAPPDRICTLSFAWMGDAWVAYRFPFPEEEPPSSIVVVGHDGTVFAERVHRGGGWVHAADGIAVVSSSGGSRWDPTRQAPIRSHLVTGSSGDYRIDPIDLPGPASVSLVPITADFSAWERIGTLPDTHALPADLRNRVYTALETRDAPTLEQLVPARDYEAIREIAFNPSVVWMGHPHDDCIARSGDAECTVWFALAGAARIVFTMEWQDTGWRIVSAHPYWAE